MYIYVYDFHVLNEHEQNSTHIHKHIITYNPFRITGSSNSNSFRLEFKSLGQWKKETRKRKQQKKKRNEIVDF